MVDSEMERKRIRGMIFDSGGVLIRTVNPVPRRELERRYGLPEGGIDELVFGCPLWRDVQMGRLTSGEFWERVGQELGLRAGELAEVRQAFWAGDELDTELLGLIRHLRSMGYRTGLLSNAPADFRDGLELLMPGAFDGVVISGCEGLMKPAPEIFLLSLDRVGLRAEEVVFVDDFRVNVEAACEIGMKAIQFRGAPLLRMGLRELGVLVPDPVLEPLVGIRALVFDWGGVLERSPDEKYFAWWERWLNVQPGTLVDVLWGRECRLLEVGAMTLDEFGDYVARSLNLGDAQQGQRFVDEFYTADWLNEEVVAAVRRLRERYKVALVSNGFPGQDIRVREQYGLDLHAEFDIYLNSADVGLRKPDPAIYHLALEQLGVAAGETLLLDDHLRNVDVARSLGLHALQFVDPASSLPQLEMLLGQPIGVDAGG